ncbi:PQQ-dependent sugar dehydrogenase [Sphingosinicella sp. CPCC 101087]|uniref:PQQ-dependent sugar dehydrogenase n=1 Tax=Sphingosinicella sp. CPCC 101087 TaxID=2497754 RepID=UPI00101B6BE0|nr:PQQ-dependent sugar dehydrogenase [Sphingosinicella sp. CPCC 101087]
MRALRTALLPVLALIGCTANGDVADGAAAENQAGDASAQAQAQPFQVTPIAEFQEPWAMTFLPGGRQALITEKEGRLKLWTVGGGAIDVSGTPSVAYGGQGGFGDVIVHPDFASNNIVYLSWAEAGDGETRGAAVGRARLVVEGEAARLEDLQVIWRQQPKVTGQGHYAHRLLFSPDGSHLFVSSGDRQKFAPAQDMNANLGKILRLNPDGSVPEDNPFAGQGGVAAQVWTLGHRNPLGIAFAPDGRFWEIEMGPEGGDELNIVIRGRNYGYPIVSNGDHYDGRPIPDHDTRPDFEAPKVTWTPVISPGDMIIYTGELFPQWRGDALVAGLSSEALVHVDLQGDSAREANRWPMGRRIREVEQAPDGSIYLLEDGDGGRLLHLTPAR